ncbi:MAG: protein kinase domain-containing protein [Myxococcota bacterium]
MEPVRLKWELASPSGMRELWGILSDTDRFNRAAGFDYRFDEAPGARPVGRTSSLGLELTWDEMPWEYEAPRWFRARRRFRGGPVEDVEVELTLSPGEPGTRVRYEVRLFPRSALWRPLLAAQAAAITRPQLDRALRRALGAEGPYDPPPPPLSEDAEARLAAAIRGLPSRTVAEALAVTLREAPLAVQDRLRPLALARRWGVDGDDVVATFLAAVRAGVLAMRWDLLCPACRVAKAQATALGDGPAQVHCASCDIRYDASFPDNVEVVFRAAPAIRDFSVPVQCAVSPARTPHVVAKRTLSVGKPLEWVLDLEPGGYRVRGPGEALHVEVGVPCAPLVATVDVTAAGVRPPFVRLGPGVVSLMVRNRAGAPVELVLEERRRPPGTLTAGSLLQLPAAKGLLPADALRPGIALELFDGAVLAVEGPPREQAARTWRGNGVTLGVWPDLDGALEAAKAVAGDARWACGVEVGPVVLVDGVPSGRAVEGALAAARAAGVGRVGLADGARGLAGEVRFPPVRYAQPEDAGVATVPGLRVGGMLGEGGFGRVYAAEDTASGAACVVKVLKPEHATDPGRVQRFFDEGRILAEVAHPNAVRVYDWGETPERLLYLVMERLDGRELADVLKERGALDPAFARRLARDVLGALAVVHRRGIVHRDIKPANVFVCDDGVAKVLDFGIARRVEEAPDPEEARFAVGTPTYMSPEQVERVEDVDGRADLYALGVTLYECLSGRRPFTGKNAVVVALKRLEEDPPPLPEAPEALASVVMRALARDRDARWATAEEMERALARE